MKSYALVTYDLYQVLLTNVGGGDLMRDCIPGAVLCRRNGFCHFLVCSSEAIYYSLFSCIQTASKQLSNKHNKRVTTFFASDWSSVVV